MPVLLRSHSIIQPSHFTEVLTRQGVTRLRWGISLPRILKPITTVKASALGQPAFREAFMHGRCTVPFVSYFETRKILLEHGKGMHFIPLGVVTEVENLVEFTPVGDLLSLAAIRMGRSFAILLIETSPVILEHAREWLDEEDPNEAALMMLPFDGKIVEKVWH